MNVTIVSASILSADLCSLGDDLDRAKESGCDHIHFDVMDGVFVNNISYGIPVLSCVRKRTDMFIDAHLMITEPENHVASFCDSGADMVTFHPEASKDPMKTLEIIKSKGKLAGVVLNADQPFSVIEPYLDKVDMVLIMTVQAGFGGQSFMADRLEMVKKVKELKDKSGYKYLIQLDGGVSPDNVQLCVEAGMEVAVAGSAVFKAPNPKQAVEQMQVYIK